MPAPNTTVSRTDPALLLREVHLVPIRGEAPGEPVDVLVRGDRVVETGPRLTRPAGAEEIAGEGRWLTPGLWDAHVHMGQWTLSSARLDLAGARSPEEAVRMVAERHAELPDLPIIGWGHRPSVWRRPPLVSDLDAVSTEVPIILIAGDGHHGWLNTHALMMLAIPLREGVVSEGEWFGAYGRMMAVLGEEGTGPEAYARAMEGAAAQGVVGIVDFEFSGGVAEWTHRYAEGAGLLQVRMASYADGLDDVIARGLATGDPLPDCDGQITMGPLKIISDGSLNTRTAWCCDPYAEIAVLGYPNGQANQTPSELRALLHRAREHRLEVAVHAIGDMAVNEALGAFADSGARGSIEHAQLIQHEDVTRMADLGVVASIQPHHLIDDRDVAEHLWPGRGGRCFAYRWMLDAGVELAMGSDAPVSPLDPWLAIASAVFRGEEGRDAWHPEQTITPAEALAASVDGQPTVAAGGRADLALLETDPLLADGDGASTAARLRQMQVALTVNRGRVIHRAL